MGRTTLTICTALAVAALLAVTALSGCATTEGRGESGKAPSINVPSIPSLPVQVETAPPPLPRRYTEPAGSNEPPAADSAPAPDAGPSSAPSSQPCPS